MYPSFYRGVQYGADEYIKILKEHSFTISMSRKGNPYDNAQAESFMKKMLKVEKVYVSEYRRAQLDGFTTSLPVPSTQLPQKFFIHAPYARVTISSISSP